ncbi:MAG: SGNH/GDSL hydrolase family protein, partial [Bradyrhizobium sp.]|nr:SGNH/GDSL hydrolase family protein [Bradyrhizobium sp.]
MRIVISNEFGTRPVTIGSASVALSAGGNKIDPATVKPVTFGGKPSAVIPPGAPLISDSVELPTRPLSSVAVSFYLPKRTGITS